MNMYFFNCERKYTFKKVNAEEVYYNFEADDNEIGCTQRFILGTSMCSDDYISQWKL